MAPELFKKEAFDKSVDTYAFGFILYEVGISSHGQFVLFALSLTNP